MLLRSVQSVPIFAHIWTRVLLYLFSILNKGRVRKPKRYMGKPHRNGTKERLPGNVRGEFGSSKKPALVLLQ